MDTSVEEQGLGMKGRPMSRSAPITTSVSATAVKRDFQSALHKSVNLRIPSLKSLMIFVPIITAPPAIAASPRSKPPMPFSNAPTLSTAYTSQKPRAISRHGMVFECIKRRPPSGSAAPRAGATAKRPASVDSHLRHPGQARRSRSHGPPHPATTSARPPRENSASRRDANAQVKRQAKARAGLELGNSYDPAARALRQCFWSWPGSRPDDREEHRK